MNLIADQPANESVITQLFDGLGTDFGVVQQEALDMLFLDLPDMQPLMIETRPTYVVAETTHRAGHIGNFGYCVVANDSAGGSINITWPFEDLLPKRILKALDDSARLGVSVLEPNDEAWLAKWSESFSVKVLRQPEHGKFRGEGSIPFVGYMPEKGYLGKDRVDILIEGRDPEGRPISAQANIFVRVVSTANLQRLLRDDSKMRAYIKQNCPAPTEFWKIGSKPSTGALEDGAAVFHSTVGNVNLLSLMTDAARNLTFSGLANGALGQTTGTAITLDWNAAGHGWFIDPTPGLNEEFLPTADPNVWKARPGSAAEGRMDLLSVLLHEYGHALGLDHSPGRVG